VNAEQLAEWLERNLPRLSRFKHGPCITVRHVLNWGGFVNHSFSIDDGSRRYHLKITNDLDSVSKLQSWRKIHHLLELRYKAPELIDWMDFPEIGFAGLLLRHVDGGIANFCENPSLIAQLIEMVRRLHRDDDVRVHFNVTGTAKTYFDHFVETYIDRFTADLEAIALGRLPFVSLSLFNWMQRETGRLRETANSVQAFHNPALEPIHGDLNEGNVLIAPNDWFVVDWDDLALGDPAVELAVLLWPMIYKGKEWSEFSIPDLENGFAERIDLCLRAQLLDEVIDPLADYVEASAVPSKEAEVRLVKRKRHEEALERYEGFYDP
jgi:aminoglycoside phosphotransferase (APT) family kinase protein